MRKKLVQSSTTFILTATVVSSKAVSNLIAATIAAGGEPGGKIMLAMLRASSRSD